MVSISHSAETPKFSLRHLTEQHPKVARIVLGTIYSACLITGGFIISRMSAPAPGVVPMADGTGTTITTDPYFALPGGTNVIQLKATGPCKPDGSQFTSEMYVAVDAGNGLKPVQVLDGQGGMGSQRCD